MDQHTLNYAILQVLEVYIRLEEPANHCDDYAIGGQTALTSVYNNLAENSLTFRNFSIEEAVDNVT